jgi:hypothetical protein
MPKMSLDTALWIAGVASETAVLGLLLYRRIWRTLPIFSAFCLWSLLSDAGLFFFRSAPNSYFTAYLTAAIVDSVLEFCVLIELAWSVLRPLRRSMPRGAFAVVGILVLGVAAAIWPFANIPGFGSLPPQWHVLMRTQQTASILRIVFFLTLSGCSQLLSISWRNRELQVATGLGFYSLVGLAVAMVHTHQTSSSQYSHLAQVEVAGYICSLLYWVWCFVQQEAERREFTPQMQNLLLAMAGTAKTTRAALVDHAEAKMRKPWK